MKFPAITQRGMWGETLWRAARGISLLVAVAAVCVIGRTMPAQAQAAACPPGQDCPCTWSNWLDRDDPSGVGDNETLADFIKEKKAPCARPTAVQCRFKGGAVWGHQTLPLGPVATAGAGYACTVAVGGTCQNSQTRPPGTPSNPSCKDSEVRFCCAK